MNAEQIFNKARKRHEAQIKTLKTKLGNKIAKIKSERLTLARAVMEKAYTGHTDCSSYWCEQCGGKAIKHTDITHKPDCPVLLAERIIKESEDE